MRPNTACYYINFGAALRSLGRLKDAVAVLRLAIRLEPGAPEAHSNMAPALLALGEAQPALDAAETALRLHPDLPAGHLNRGLALTVLDRGDEAVAAYERALELRPGWPEAYLQLGNALHQLGRFDDAAAAYRQALSVRPDFVAALTNLGSTLSSAGQLVEAASVLREAVRLAPCQAEPLLNLGSVLRLSGRLDEALATQQHILAHQPDYWPAWAGHAAILHDLGLPAAALEAWDQSLTLHPEQPDTRYSRALTLLLMGDFARGWDQLEWRWQAQQHRARLRHTEIPLWAGEDLAGRTILLHVEEGLGDSIQFARYVPLVAGRGATVVLEAYPALMRLFRSLPGVSRLIVQGETPPHCDLQCPLQSLPRAFATSLETIPAETPYLRAGSREAWAERLGPRHGPRIGLVWAGRPTHGRDRDRSIALDRLTPLLAFDTADWFGLQLGRQDSLPTQVIDLSSHLTDMAETAAALCEIDLLISVDTAVAHLAGALGRPVWLLLPFSPDWRWMLGRTDSPWYPTMRLFRQMRPGDWETVIDAVGISLRSAFASGD